MNKLKINLKSFLEDTDASIVTSFMMAGNDIERMVFLRNFVEKLPPGLSNEPPYFRISLNGYTANILVAHVCESYDLLKKIKREKSRTDHKLIEDDAELKEAYDCACAYLELPVLKSWVNLRNKVIFHYEEYERELPEALEKVRQKHAYSWCHFGGVDELTFYDLAFESIDSIGAKFKN